MSLQESNTTSETFDYYPYNQCPLQKAQSIHSTAGCTITTVTVKLRRLNLDPGGTAQFSFCYSPSGNAIATRNFDVSTLAFLTDTEVSIDFSSDNITIPANDFLYLRIIYSYASLGWYYSTLNPYPTGHLEWYFTGWAAPSGYDYWFKLYGDPLPTLSKAITPTPTNAATGMDVQSLDSNVFGTSRIRWANGGNATKYDVYYNFGLQTGAVYLVASNVTDAGATTQYSLSWPIADATPGSVIFYGGLTHNKQYKWRIDAKDNNGQVVTGDQWTFTTAPIYYPTPDYSPTQVWPRDDGDDVKAGDPLALGTNSMVTFKRLVAAAGNTFFVEDI